MAKGRRVPSNEHASITALMGEAQTGESAQDVIRRKCRVYTAHAKSLGWAGPKFDPKVLASLLGIQVEEMPEPWDGDGRIFPRRGCPVIQYRPDQSLERQGFTICHEIAHTCFPDCFKFVRAYNADAEEDTPAHRRFEKLCNVGAGELLMPHEDFQADLAGKKICLQGVCGLGERYGTSVDAAVRRLLDHTDHPCAAVFLNDLPFDGFGATPGGLRVQWFCRAKTFKCYLQAGTPVPRSTCLLKAIFQENSFEPAIKETWWIGGKPRSWYVEGLRLPPVPQNPSYPRILALLHSRLQH